jgi:hypothetical protein
MLVYVYFMQFHVEFQSLLFNFVHPGDRYVTYTSFLHMT